MVGGDEHAYARVEPVLRELGTPTRVGENGQGLVLKLAINISLAVQMLAFSEGLLLAERSGIDRGLAIDVMTQSPIGSPMLKARAGLLLELPDEAWFNIELMQKDVALALDAGRRLPVRCRPPRRQTRCSPWPARRATESVTWQRCSRCWPACRMARRLHE